MHSRQIRACQVRLVMISSIRSCLDEKAERQCSCPSPTREVKSCFLAHFSGPTRTSLTSLHRHDISTSQLHDTNQTLPKLRNHAYQTNHWRKRYLQSSRGHSKLLTVRTDAPKRPGPRPFRCVRYVLNDLKASHWTARTLRIQLPCALKLYANVD